MSSTLLPSLHGAYTWINVIYLPLSISSTRIILCETKSISVMNLALLCCSKHAKWCFARSFTAIPLRNRMGCLTIKNCIFEENLEDVVNADCCKRL